MRLAVLQATGKVGDPDTNLRSLAAATERAAVKGADLLLTPELFLPGYDPARVHGQDGTRQRAAAADLARRHRVAVVVSTVEHDGEARYISATLIEADGRELLHYRKTHLFGAETRVFRPGQSVSSSVLFQGLRVGLGICFDMEFPEYVRALAVDGVQLVLAPTAVPLRVIDAADPLPFDAGVVPRRVIPTRALESSVFIGYANHAGPDFAGHSCIATPVGELATAADADSETLLYQDITPELARIARIHNPYLQQRRADLYPTASTPT